MDRHEVIAFLDSMVRGLDPAAGAAVSLEVFRGADVVNALQTASSLLAADGARRGTFGAAGTPWSSEEDAQLAQEFDAGRTVAQMALQHRRTSSAITLRLVKLGKVDPASVRTRERSVRVA